MDKQPLTLRIDDDIALRLDKISARYGMTKNTLLAAAAYELSRVPPEQLWERLARLAKEEASKRPRQSVAVAGPVVDAIEAPTTG